MHDGMVWICLFLVSPVFIVNMTVMLYNTSQSHDIECTRHACCLSDRIPRSFPQDPQSVSAPVHWEWTESVCVLKAPSCWCQSTDAAQRDLAAISFYSSPLSSELDSLSLTGRFPWLCICYPGDGGCRCGGDVNPAFCVPGGSTDPQSAGQACRWGVTSNSEPRSRDLTAFCC